MSTLPQYFASTFVKKTRAYFDFYSKIYLHIWRIPRVYDLRDKTLSIRLIRHTVATSGLFVVAIYVLSELTESLYARSASNSDLLLFLLSAYFFVYGLGLVLYCANKIYPRKKLTFRECAALLHFFFLQLSPPLVILLLFIVQNSMNNFLLDFFSVGNIFYCLLLGSSIAVIFRNIMLLLGLTFLQTLYFQCSVLLVEFLLVILFWLTTLLFLFLPTSIQAFIIQILVFFYGLVGRLF